MFHIVAPTPAQAMTTEEARRILSDLGYAMQVDPARRMLAFRLGAAARKGQACPLMVVFLTGEPPKPEPPKDAA